MTEDSTRTNKQILLELFVLSFLSLFIELLFIRWMSADIRLFNIFKNFPLVACFVGLGIGCAQTSDRWYRSAPLNMLGSVLLIKFLLPITGLAQLMPSNLASYNWFDPTGDAGLQAIPTTLEYMVLLVGILAGPFFVMTCLGARIGRLFDASKPLAAYTVNIIGAIIGSIAFSLASFFNLSPAALFAGAMLILGGSFFAQYKTGGNLAKAFAGVATLATVTACMWPVPVPDYATDFWSPYQHLTLIDMGKAKTDKSGKPHFQLMVNGRDYQQCWDRSISGDPYLDIYWRRCFMPYQLKKNPPEVAVVAAGMGMDVQAALEGGAGHIDACDIDPVIIGLGKQLNPNHPYDSSKVTPVCDDARHFFNTTPKKYDLVVFSHLDSHTVIGQSSSVRLDNFVYTKESFQRALSLLNDHGLMMVCFNARKNWFRDRMYRTLTEAVGYKPIIFKDKADEGRWSFFCLVGPAVQKGEVIALPEGVEPIDMSAQQKAPVRTLTDDWPYLYVNDIQIDWTYILICGELLLLALLCSRGFLFSKLEPTALPGGLWQLFFLGAGFMLLELQAISRLALIYGTTWITSSVVINGILVMILLANLVAMRWRSQLRARYLHLYAAMFISLTVSYLLPTEQIVAAVPGLGGALLVSFLTLLPMFVAGMIFPTFFAEQPHSGIALAYNMLGSVIGAFLEYQSNFTGINSVVLLSIALYGLSLACLFIPAKKEPLQS